MKAEFIETDKGTRPRLVPEFHEHVTILKALARIPHADGGDVHIFVSEACQHQQHRECKATGHATRCAVCNVPCLCSCHEPTVRE